VMLWLLVTVVLRKFGSNSIQSGSRLASQ